MCTHNPLKTTLVSTATSTLASSSPPGRLSDRSIPGGYLQHPHEDVPAVAVLQLRLGADAVHQVEQQLARHGLDVAGQRLVVDVLGEELHGQGQVGQRQVLPDVVHQVGQRAVGQGPACGQDGERRGF